jgi:curved DNA-binding protein CbpA
MRFHHAEMGTHYDSLKVTEDAPQEVIRAAYRVLSLKYHPDTSSGSPQALRMMQTLNEAYAILSDAGKRADYDGELHRLRHPATIPKRMTRAVRRDVRFSAPRPAWLKASLLFLSDARVVIPAVALIWWFVLRLLAHA